MLKHTGENCDCRAQKFAYLPKNKRYLDETWLVGLWYLQILWKVWFQKYFLGRYRA